MKSASKLGVAQTTPDRAKSRNASAFSPHVEPHNDGIVNDPEIKAEASDLAVDRGVSEAGLCDRPNSIVEMSPKGAPRSIRSASVPPVSDVATVEGVPDLAIAKTEASLKIG
jgi:hypothetical protein